VAFLSDFGNLYYGNLKQSVFETQYCSTRSVNLSKLKSYQNLTNPDHLQSVNFIMHMLRLAQHEKWVLPGTLTELDTKLHWGCGNSRIFASGMSFVNPQETVKFLVFQKKQTSETQYLDNPIRITNDIELHNVLGISTQSSTIPLAQLAVDILREHDHARVVLELISNNDDTYMDAGKEYADNFVDWQQTNGLIPKLKIYTDWPDHIVNYGNTWDFEIKGPSIHYKENLNGYGRLELFLYQRNQDKSVGSDLELFVLSPRRINIAELLFWVNNKHTAFVESTLDFVLFKKQPEYLTTRINISHIL
jgi:hypothetical protein